VEVRGHQYFLINNIPEQPIKLPMMVSPETTHAAKVEEKSKQGKMKSKMTKKEIKKKMENVLKREDFKMKIGRLMFWCICIVIEYM
jgi:hypothetical protein